MNLSRALVCTINPITEPRNWQFLISGQLVHRHGNCKPIVGIWKSKIEIFVGGRHLDYCLLMASRICILFPFKRCSCRFNSKHRVTLWRNSSMTPTLLLRLVRSIWSCVSGKDTTPYNYHLRYVPQFKCTFPICIGTGLGSTFLFSCISCCWMAEWVSEYYDRVNCWTNCTATCNLANIRVYCFIGFS